MRFFFLLLFFSQQFLSTFLFANDSSYCSPPNYVEISKNSTNLATGITNIFIDDRDADESDFEFNKTKSSPLHSGGHDFYTNGLILKNTCFSKSSPKSRPIALDSQPIYIFCHSYRI